MQEEPEPYLAPPAPTTALHVPPCTIWKVQEVLKREREKQGGVCSCVSGWGKLYEDFDLPPQGPSKRSPAAGCLGRSLYELYISVKEAPVLLKRPQSQTPLQLMVWWQQCSQDGAWQQRWSARGGRGRKESRKNVPFIVFMDLALKRNSMDHINKSTTLTGYLEYCLCSCSPSNAPERLFPSPSGN